jgi:hypothetical protein
MFIRQVVQLGSGAVLYRTNDVPSLRQELDGHGVAETP